MNGEDVRGSMKCGLTAPIRQLHEDANNLRAGEGVVSSAFLSSHDRTRGALAPCVQVDRTGPYATGLVNSHAEPRHSFCLLDGWRGKPRKELTMTTILAVTARPPDPRQEGVQGRICSYSPDEPSLLVESAVNIKRSPETAARLGITGAMIAGASASLSLPRSAGDNRDSTVRRSRRRSTHSKAPERPPAMRHSMTDAPTRDHTTRGALFGTATLGIGGAPTRFLVEEIVRQSTANNVVTSG